MDQQALNFSAPPKEAAAKEQAPKIFTVGALMGLVRSAVEGNFKSVWVTGEVSNLRTSPSGHTYFSLKDEKALLKTALFKGYAAKIKFQLKDGMELIVHGNLSVYEKGSDLNLVADHCEPKGVGALQLAFEQLKEKLLKEGLFAPDRKKPLPFLPRKIGIVTSPTGAAIRDILNILGRRYPGMDVLLYPVRVQGDGAAAEISQAIGYFNTRDDIDVMIVGRGGGSLEDLWAFNEEIVARAMFASKIPIISAVGHEIDFTIADFVADRRAPTPSAAAEIVVPKKEDLLRTVTERRAHLVRALSVCADMKRKWFEQIRSHLKPPTARFPDLLLQIDSLQQRIHVGVKMTMERSASRIGKLAAELSHLSPLAVLAKGYSVVYKDGQVVKRAADVKKGDEIKVRMSEGNVEAKIL
jgi:exodeoxyribonuclease VII large subunit